MIDGLIYTFKGHKINLYKPDENEIDMDDISHVLSYQCRFGGNVNKFHSVAQHSLEVQQLLSEYDTNTQFAGLMHDAQEAYMTDLPTPIKVLLPDYSTMEERLAQKIRDKYDINYGRKESDLVNNADKVSLMTEIEELIPSKLGDKTLNYKADDSIRDLVREKIEPEDVKKRFEKMFNEL